MTVGQHTDTRFRSTGVLVSHRTSKNIGPMANQETVGEVQQSESSIVLSNLQPDQNYIVRVVVINSLDFRSPSDPVRIHTKSAASDDFYNTIVSTASDDATNQLSSGPVLRPFKTLPETFSNPAIPPLMTRETSNGPGATRRVPTGRRPSPATWTSDTQHVSNDEYASPLGTEETQQQLTEKLDEISRETAELEKTGLVEEQENVEQKRQSIKERDELRASLKEKDNTSREYKKTVNALERENTAAQSKKSLQERALQQRNSEMQKLRDDTARWVREITELNNAVTQSAADKQNLLEEIEQEKIALRESHAQDVQGLKTIEEGNKAISSRIKTLERGKSNSPMEAEAHDQYQRLLAEEVEDDRKYEERRIFLEEQYRNAWAEMEVARRLCHDASTQLHAVRQRQIELSHMIPPPAAINQPISRASSLRQRRTPSGPSNISTAPMTGFPDNAQPFTNGMSTLPEGFISSTGSFFNMNNGMTVGHQANGQSSFSPSDLDRLTGGAPMSPGAGANLLPAGLLSGVDEDLAPTAAESRHSDALETDTSDRQQSTGQMFPGLGAFTGVSRLPGLGATTMQVVEHPGKGPASPVSVSSRPPSVFASPGAGVSNNNLPFQSPDYPADSDGRSIRSIRSNRASSSGVMHSGSRFAQVLGLDKLNRQRGKTMPDDGLALGSLPKSQSQSMPRDTQTEEDESEGSSRRRNSSHSGNFFNVLKSGSALSKASGAETTTGQNAAPARRRPFPNVFGGKDAWPTMRGGDNRPSSPRPGSTHSTELPRPSSENTGWNVWASNESFGQRNSPLSADWGQTQSGALPQSRTWGSRHPSRRPSVQYASSGGAPYDILEDEPDHSESSNDQSYMQAPIGTRPTLPERPSTPKLNPAAKDFKSLFSFGGEKKEKAEKSSKGKTKDNGLGSSKAEGDSTPVTTPAAAGFANSENAFSLRDDDHSPPQSRKSRDTRSVTTADSSVLESRSSLDHTPSHTPSDAMTPTSINGSANKESFMQKLTRKSSSGKFGLPVFSRDRSKRGPDKPREATMGEEAEGDEEDAMNRSTDSMPRPTPQRPDRGSRSWSAVFTGKKGKGKEKEKEKGAEKTPSISEASLTSEATGDDAEDGL